MKTGTFDKALEIIESFPEEQKESIIEIVKRRSPIPLTPRTCQGGEYAKRSDYK